MSLTTAIALISLIVTIIFSMIDITLRLLEVYGKHKSN